MTACHQSSFEVEVASASEEGFVCGQVHELPHLVRVRANSIFDLLMLCSRLDPQGEVSRLTTHHKTAVDFIREWLGDAYLDYMRTIVSMVEVFE